MLHMRERKIVLVMILALTMIRSNVVVNAQEITGRTNRWNSASSAVICGTIVNICSSIENKRGEGSKGSFPKV